MFNKYYVLKSGDFYLVDILYNSDLLSDKEKKINHFEMDKEYKHIFYDFEEAEEIRKEIYIETGLNLEIKLLKEVENETV